MGTVVAGVLPVLGYQDLQYQRFNGKTIQKWTFHLSKSRGFDLFCWKKKNTKILPLNRHVGSDQTGRTQFVVEKTTSVGELKETVPPEKSHYSKLLLNHK
jgi:hypothetical protein